MATTKATKPRSAPAGAEPAGGVDVTPDGFHKPNPYSALAQPEPHLDTEDPDD